MEIGVCLPYMERDFDRERLLAWCARIDSGPFSSLSCGERIIGHTLEMRTTLAAAAVLTSRVRIVPSLYVLPMHSAVWAAKEIATLDLLSAGRVTLTVGVGGREHDYRAVGASFARRHERMDEQVARMRQIWRGTPPFEGCDVVGPAPVQAGGPPILAGSMGPKAIRRAAEWADGLYAFSMNGDAGHTRHMLGSAIESWQAAGRKAGPRKVGGFWCSLADDADRRLKDYVHQYLAVFGDAPARSIAATMTRSKRDAILEAIDGLESAGCDEIFLVPATADLAEIDRLGELLARR
jgi:alkanesulfonate monooxygenase SsuD/methylene tetrahydromethanopterin reductase-like flavin-dependent oxidoreductase (luciferase family)